MLLLSQAVETHFAAQLLERHAERFGYLLKDRVIDVTTLIDALHTIAGGGTVLDPEIVRHLMRRDSAADPLAALTERERDVLALMAEGRSNTAIADRLVVSRSRPSRATSPTSSPSSACTVSRTTTAGSWRSWRPCVNRADCVRGRP